MQMPMPWPKIFVVPYTDTIECSSVIPSINMVMPSYHIMITLYLPSHIDFLNGYFTNPDGMNMF